MVAFSKNDLLFILDGITVSQTHADLTNSVENNVWVIADIEVSRQILLGLIPNSLEPIGMRTISGELNNLIPGQDQYGSTDDEFPRLLDPDYIDDADTGAAEGPFPLGDPTDPATPFVTNTDYQVSGDVVDSDPRIISNLVVDQTINNPAAIVRALTLAEFDGDEMAAVADIQQRWADEVIAARILGDQAAEDAAIAAISDDYGITISHEGAVVINNTAPDEGLSAPFNSWMTLFGQFFDHGLDLVNKGGAGTVFIPLQPDDPLVTHGRDGIEGNGDEVNPNSAFMVLTRATVDAGPDGLLGTDDDVLDAFNSTSPHVDQNQTYTSHPSHQIFVREYEIRDEGPAATGLLIEGAGGGMATWGDVKAQAAAMLGVELTDAEALNIPLFAVDQYGEFIRGANGLPQFVMSDGSLFEGDLTDPVSVAEAEAATGLVVMRTGHSFLLDIAHDANPVDSQSGLFMTRYEDGNANDGVTGGAFTYDGDLLDAHFIAGDGRANENFGLTAVHHVFHQEHNRMVEHTKQVLLSFDPALNIDIGDAADPTGANAALDLLNGYLIEMVETFPTTPEEIDALIWDGDRLFQAAKFATEMQYQHLVFEEFARKVQPLVDIFASYEPGIDAAISAEFAHTVYRFGHSMLQDTVDLMDADGNLTEAGLIEAFLNPLGFNAAVSADGTVTDADILAQDASEAAGAIARAMTRQIGSEIDEFVVPSLRSNLLGLPLDLPAINIARGRETGVPSLNQARAQFFEGTGDTKLKPYVSWVDFALNIKDQLSIVNFIAAYGQHDVIRNAADSAEARANAWALVTGDLTDTALTAGDIADRLDFLNSTGAWAGVETGLNLIDFWLGGLAEKIEPFGGMLGSTFNFVFEQQLEDLQDGDRFYYLGRTEGLNFLNQLEQNSFANMIIRNTSIGDQNLLAEGGDGLGGDHLPGDIFSVPTYILEANQSRQFTGLGVDGRDDPTDGDTLLFPEVIRIDTDGDGIAEHLQYTGGEHVVLGGTDLFNDTLIGGIGDDTIWGDGGDDTIEGGDGSDILLGGDGDDIITDIGGEDNIQGQGGNDAIFSGEGFDLILAGDGKDFVLDGPGFGEVFAGSGDDFVHAGSESNTIFGNEGDDWIEGGGGNNLLVGDNGDPFLTSLAGGNDIFIAGAGDDDYDAEGGDDIMVAGVGVQRFEGVTGFDWATYSKIDGGTNVDMNLRAFNEAPLPPSTAAIQDRFDAVEGLSGGRGSDILRGSDQDVIEIRNLNNGTDSVLRNFELIEGLRAGDHGGAFDDTAIFAAGTTEFGEGDIILGGAGSDLIEGRNGDDIIDGDLMMDVRLLVRDASGAPVATAFEMYGQLYEVDPVTGKTVYDVDGEPIPMDIGGHQSLQAAVFARAVNPGNIHAVREILDFSAETDFDTVEFADVRAAFTIETDATGAIGDGDGDGFISVTHVPVGNLDLGTDLIRNIERLQFADQSITIAGENNDPTGAPLILDEAGDVPNLFFVGQVLRADRGDIADADGTTTSIFHYVWEVEETPGAGDWVPLEIINVAGDEVQATGPSITVPQLAAGLAIRVRAIFNDDNGVIENRVSAPTDLVITPSPAATEGDDFLVGTAGRDVIDGLGGNDIILGFAGNDVLRGNGDADRLEGGTGNDVLRGNGGADILLGGEGRDRLFGGGGADTIDGGEGNDTIDAGNGNDTIIIQANDGVDTIDGGGNGAAGDTLVILGDNTAEDWEIVAVPSGDPAVPGSFQVLRNGVLIATATNIEDIDLAGGGGADSFALTGDFTGILSPNTVILNGTESDETFDVTGLAGTRVIVSTGGGHDEVFGALGPNDVIEIAPGLTPIAYGDPVDNGDGTITWSTADGQHSITVEADINNPPSLSTESTPTPTPIDDTPTPPPAGGTPPTAGNDNVTIPEDVPVAIDVLANDADSEGDEVSLTDVDDPANGTVEIDDNGTPNDQTDDFLVYTPDANFNGVDEFTYEITDDLGQTAIGTVRVTVAPVNDTPVAVDDAASTDQEVGVTVDVLANDSDVEGPVAIQSVTDGANGSVVDNGDGTVTYTPDAGFSGEDSFTYTIVDSNLATATATVVVNVVSVNTPPVANDDAATTDEDISINIDVLANDTDLDADTLTVTSATANGTGAAVVNPDGTIGYTPAPDFSGQETITYTIADGNGGTDSATVTVTVNPVNDPPIAVDDAATTDEDAAVIVSVLDNDSDVEGAVTIQSVSDGANGAVVDNGDGTVTYTPDADFNGADSFTYTIVDGDGAVDTATVNVTVNPVNDDPAAVDDVAATDEDTPVNIDVLANDTDVDGDALTVVSATSADGDVVIEADGTLTFTPATGFIGAATISYTVEDGNGGSDTATVTVNVADVNEPPVAVDDAATTDEDAAVIVSVLDNDTDAEGAVTIQSVGDGANGAVVDNGDGTVTYTPDADFNGSDSFTYTIVDAGGLTSTATVNVTVDPVNDDPVATDDAASTDQDVPVNIDVLANDADVENDTLTVVSATSAEGDVVIEADGTLTFTPAAGFAGAATIAYTVEDGNGGSATASVSVSVADVNDPPVAVDDAATTDEDAAVIVSVLDNDTDAEGAVTIQSVGDGANGTVVDNGDGTVTYTPDADFNGSDSFTYTIVDAGGLTSTATVNVTVDPVNDDPVAVDDVASTDEDAPITIDVLANDTDVDGDGLTVTAASGDSGGAVVINPDGTLGYTPAAGFSGTELITYTVEDGNGGSDTATVTVTVDPAAPTGPTPFFTNGGGVFDGTTGAAIVIPHAANMLIAQGAIELVVNMGDLNGRQGLFSKDSAGNDDGGHVGMFAQGDTLLVRLQDAAGQTNSTFSIQTGAVLSVGVDHHIALTFGPGGMELFVDGQSVGTNGYTGGLLGNQEPIVVGANQWTSGNQVADVIVDPLNGSISTVNMYNSALTAGEIEALANGEPPVPVDPPSPADDAASVDEDGSVLVDVLGNDTDPNNEALTLISAQGAANGSVSVENGQVRYTPNPDFNGSDSFTYTVRNASGAEATATATVTVNAVNDLPVANDDSGATLVDAPVDIDLLANDSDVEGPVTVTEFGQGLNGSVSVTGGVATYTPNAGFEGEDSFTYTITDGDGATAMATATVSVTAEPVGPSPILSLLNPTADAFVIADHDGAHQNASGAIEVAFNLDALSNGRQALFSKDSQGFGDGGHVLAYVQNDDLRVRLQSDSGQVELTIADQIAAGQNHHLVMNFGSNGFELALDGEVLVFDQAFLQGMEGNTEDWVIGGNAWLTQPGANNPIVDTINGQILEFSVYDRDLTDNEIVDQASDYLLP